MFLIESVEVNQQQCTQPTKQNSSSLDRRTRPLRYWFEPSQPVENRNQAKKNRPRQMHFHTSLPEDCRPHNIFSWLLAKKTLPRRQAILCNKNSADPRVAAQATTAKMIAFAASVDRPS
jgi:hypothetical protein